MMFKDLLRLDSCQRLGLLFVVTHESSQVCVRIAFFVDFHFDHGRAFDTVCSGLVFSLNIDDIERVPLSLKSLFGLNIFHLEKWVLFLAK
jgi:hypothetical protein